MAGATVQWLRDGLQIIQAADEVGPLAASVADTGDVYLVPAFVGLGAPYWDPAARGAMFGLTRGATGAHIARAALEGTMLGPGLLMGRIAAREAVAQQRSEGKLPAAKPASSTGSAGVSSALPEKPPATQTTDPESLRAWREGLRQQVTEPRPGYLHFEKAHAVVLERNLDCAQCHREPLPLALNAEQLDRHALIQACVICHGSVKE